jgi:hypothetical protein
MNVKHCLFDHLSVYSYLQTSLVLLNFVYTWNWEQKDNWVGYVVVLSELKETPFWLEQLMGYTNSARLYEGLKWLLHVWSVSRLAAAMLHLLWLLVFCCAVRGQEILDLKDSSWTNRSAVDHKEKSTSKLYKLNFWTNFTNTEDTYYLWHVLYLCKMK